MPPVNPSNRTSNPCLRSWLQLMSCEFLLQSHPLIKGYERKTMWDQDQASIQELTMQMDHLVTVSVKNFLGLDDEVDFMGKLLSWAPALEEAEIEWKGEVDCGMVFKKLLALPRASHKAKLIVT